jgi:hypothetical protein
MHADDVFSRIDELAERHGVEKIRTIGQPSIRGMRISRRIREGRA